MIPRSRGGTCAGNGCGGARRIAALSLEFVPAGERQLPRRDLEQHHAERPDVASGVRAVTEQRLRRDVGERARDGGGALRAVDRLRDRFARARFEPAREAEIEHLDAVLRTHDDIGGLEIAMDDAALVRMREGAGDLRAVPEHGFDGQAVERQHLGERAAVDELHRDEHAAAGIADLVDGADVRMIEVRGRAGLVEEPAAILGCGRSGRSAANQLDRHGALQPLVAGAIDHAHAALAEAGLDAVLPERLADHRVTSDSRAERRIRRPARGFGTECPRTGTDGRVVGRGWTYAGSELAPQSSQERHP